MEVDNFSIFAGTEAIMVCDYLWFPAIEGWGFSLHRVCVSSIICHSCPRRQHVWFSHYSKIRRKNDIPFSKYLKIFFSNGIESEIFQGRAARAPSSPFSRLYIAKNSVLPNIFLTKLRTLDLNNLKSMGLHNHFLLQFH